MAYTEIKQKNGKKYYYRVKSIRNGRKFMKKRIYLGKNLSDSEIFSKIRNSDEKLGVIEKESKQLKKLIPKIKKILKKNKVRKAGIFGSYVRGEEKKNSDIDIVIEPPKGIGWGFVGIQFELEDKLKKKDLLSYNGIHPLLKDRILKEEIRII